MWHKNRHIDQWKRIDSTEINPHLCDQLIFHKEDKNINWGKDSLLNKCCWENWTHTWKRSETRLPLYTHTRKNSKGIKDLKMNKRLKYKLWHHQSPRGKHRLENFRYSMQQYFHQYIPSGKGHKWKNKQMELQQNKKLLHS